MLGDSHFNDLYDLNLNFKLILQEDSVTREKPPTFSNIGFCVQVQISFYVGLTFIIQVST